MFKYFIQEDGNINWHFEGSGLSIAYKLIELMQGEISFESTKGEGIKFLMRIPIL